jgi:hypothetical protein
MSRAVLVKGKRWTHSFVGTLLLTLTGPIVWSLHFLIVYGAHAVMCSRDASAHVEIVIVAATLIALAVLGLIVVRSPAERFAGSSQTRHALKAMMRSLALLSGFGIAWAGGAILFLPACLPVR